MTLWKPKRDIVEIPMYVGRPFASDEERDRAFEKASRDPHSVFYAPLNPSVAAQPDSH